MTVIYLDCFSGIAGDMTLSALVDAGADDRVLRDVLDGIGCSSASVEFAPENRNGMRGLHMKVTPPETPVDSSFPELRNRLQQAALPDSVRENAVSALEEIGAAESRVHDVSCEELTFGEMGGFDLLLDLAGTAALLENLGARNILFPSVPVSRGITDSHHGQLPVPVPATLELLTSLDVHYSGLQEEITTPTGAAILKTMGTQVEGMPDMAPEQIGYGAGTRDLSDRPNLLRAVVGPENQIDREHHTPERVCVLETNIDDTTPEVISATLNRALEKGALDAYAVPVTMKKSRPGTLLGLLCKCSDRSRFRRFLFRETSTFGIREQVCRRSVMVRNREEVETPFGNVTVKIGRFRDIERMVPEFDDCVEIANRRNIPVRDVQEKLQNFLTENDSETE